MAFNGERNIRDTGLNSINNTGDGATIIVNPKSPKGLNRTLLFEYCYKFSDVEDAPKSDTVPPSHIPEKMEYNEIVEYKEIFYDVDHYLGDVEAILKDIPKRERILASIKYRYGRFRRSAEWNSKDELCDLVYDYMMDKIGTDEKVSDMMLEDAELGIHALMYYAFVKCKLLDPVPPKKVG